VKEYWGFKGKFDKVRYEEELERWRTFCKAKSDRAFFMTIFSPDEKFVLNNRPADRTDPLLVQVVEEMGEEADGAHADLKVVEIPDGTKYEIAEYDGREHIAEVHQTWY
jgi:hypothetical protein